MAKKIFVTIPLNLEASLDVPPSYFNDVDLGIQKGQICLLVQLHPEDDSGNMGISVYADKIKGILTFSRTENKLHVVAAGTYKMEYYGDYPGLKCRVNIFNLSIAGKSDFVANFSPDNLGVFTGDEVLMPSEA
jgi:hypothetical protein